jgi:hypothetical protein
MWQVDVSLLEELLVALLLSEHDAVVLAPLTQLIGIQVRVLVTAELLLLLGHFNLLLLDYLLLLLCSCLLTFCLFQDEFK